MKDYHNENQTDQFLMFDPLLLKGVDEALGRIIKAVNEREKIVVYGYGDLDSLTGIALLTLVFRYLNADVDYFIPSWNEFDRTLNKSDVENNIRLLGTKLIITVGCSAKSLCDIEYCRSLGIDVIVTDYKDVVYESCGCVILNPKQKSCRYPFKELGAVGVAFKLAQAISYYYNMKCINKYIDLVMLGTLASKAVVTGENKAIIDAGIEHLLRTNNYGLRAFMKVCGIHNNRNDLLNTLKYIILESYNLKVDKNAWIIVELFITSNIDRAEQISKYLIRQVFNNSSENCALNTINT